MNLTEKINSDLKIAIKNSDRFLANTLRNLKTEFTKIEKNVSSVGKTLDESVYVVVLQKCIKQREDAAVIYKNASRQDLYENEMKEFNILMQYAPKQLDESEIEIIVKSEIELNSYKPSDFGKLMKTLSTNLKGKADGKIISSIAKRLLV